MAYRQQITAPIQQESDLTLDGDQNMEEDEREINYEATVTPKTPEQKELPPIATKNSSEKDKIVRKKSLLFTLATLLLFYYKWSRYSACSRYGRILAEKRP